MKLSKETIEIFENFTQINSEFLFREGSKISTIGKNRSYLAEAEIKEIFPMRVGVNNLKKVLLCANALGDDPDFYFSENALKISNANTEMIFGLVAEDQITTPKKELTYVLSGIQFELNSSVLKEIRNYGRIMRSLIPKGNKKTNHLGYLYLIGNGEKIYLEVRHDLLGNDCEKMTISLDKPCSQKFCMILDIELMKMIEDDYVCEISNPSSNGSNGLALFTAKTKHIKYYLASYKFTQYEVTPEIKSIQYKYDKLMAEY